MATGRPRGRRAGRGGRGSTQGGRAGPAPEVMMTIEPVFGSYAQMYRESDYARFPQEHRSGRVAGARPPGGPSGSHGHGGPAHPSDRLHLRPARRGADRDRAQRAVASAAHGGGRLLGAARAPGLRLPCAPPAHDPRDRDRRGPPDGAPRRGRRARRPVRPALRAHRAHAGGRAPHARHLDGERGAGTRGEPPRGRALRPGAGADPARLRPRARHGAAARARRPAGSRAWWTTSRRTSSGP